jgi:drug/metabolite transporter (DMT)-like permease
MPRRLQADLLLLVICVFWGATFVLEQAALRHVSTLLFLVLRFGLAVPALLMFGGRPWQPPVFPGFVAGVFLFLGCFLQAQGLRYTSPSKSAFITGLCVIIVPIAYSALRRAWPGWGVGTGAALALLGLALITGVVGWSAHQTSGFTSINRGDIWTLACALAFAVHILLMGHYSPRCRPQDFAAAQVFTAFLLCGLTFWWAESPYLDPAPVLWWGAAIGGLICTAAAYLSQAWAQQFTTPSHTALIFSSEPVFAWITSAVVLGERLGTGATLGALLILAGILLSETLGRPGPEAIQ